MKIAIGADHAGYALKDQVRDALRRAGHEVIDLGTNSAESTDYPDYAGAVADDVVSGVVERGILVCSTGVGMSIAANRHDGIRCALVSEATSAALCRAHNDANVLALGARLIGEEAALDILRVFLSTPYEGGRHDLRLAKLAAI